MIVRVEDHYLALLLQLFYKPSHFCLQYVLDVCKVKASAAYVSGGTGLTRTPVIGTQDYDTRPDEYPLTKPMPKTIAPYLVGDVLRVLKESRCIIGLVGDVLSLLKESSCIIGKYWSSSAQRVSAFLTFYQPFLVINLLFSIQ